MAAVRKPKIAVWKFASCDGCQLSLLDCEDELLSVVGAVEIANFPEATSSKALTIFLSSKAPSLPRTTKNAFTRFAALPSC